jgi:hypothetical protein
VCGGGGVRARSTSRVGPAWRTMLPLIPVQRKYNDRQKGRKDDPKTGRKGKGRAEEGALHMDLRVYVGM